MSGNTNRKPEIKFISYNGAYPNLCSGTLAVEIDGKHIEFCGYSRNDENATFPKFWSSGGRITFDEVWEDHVIKGEWELSGYTEEKDYPEWLYTLLPDILDLMNENVPYGCCGGCV